MIKKCSKFGEEKTTAKFSKNRSQSDGLTVWCKECHRIFGVTLGRIRKKRLVEHLGGKCKLCGYDRCPAALDFHHINPEEKEFRLSGSKMRCKFETLVKEAEKCMLLCANCHRELHYNESEEH